MARELVEGELLGFGFRKADLLLSGAVKNGMRGTRES